MYLHIIPSTIVALDQVAASHALDEYHAGIAHESYIELVTHLRGMRQYIHCKPFVLIPDITLMIGEFFT